MVGCFEGQPGNRFGRVRREQETPDGTHLIDDPEVAQACRQVASCENLAEAAARLVELLPEGVRLHNGGHYLAILRDDRQLALLADQVIFGG